MNAQNEISQSYIIELVGDTVLVASDSKSISWVKSGTTTHEIRILSNSNTVLDKTYSHRTAFNLIGVQKVHVEGILFNNAKNGIQLVDADRCSIEFCQFRINDDGNKANGGAAIELSGEWIDIDSTQTSQSDYNIIKNNYTMLTDEAHMEIDTTNKTNLWHGIYVSRSSNNTVKYNTINNSFGNGIQFWHENIQDNDLENNFVYIKRSLDNDIRHNILIGKDYDPDCLSCLPISGNSVINNFIISDFQEPKSQVKNHYDSFSGFGNLNNLVIRPLLKSNNTTTDNVELFIDIDDLKAVDPLYFDFDKDMDIVELLSGDFDGDLIIDDIAALVSTGPNSSAILIWYKEELQGKDFLNYNGALWESAAFNAHQLEGRLVSGDFTGDGKWDIAGIRDLGKSNSKNSGIPVSGHTFRPGWLWIHMVDIESNRC